MLPKAKFWCNFQFFLVQTKAGDQTDCLQHNAHPKVATRRVALVFVRCGIKLDFPFLSFLRSICAESQLTVVEGNVLFLKQLIVSIGGIRVLPGWKTRKVIYTRRSASPGCGLIPLKVR